MTAAATEGSFSATLNNRAISMAVNLCSRCRLDSCQILPSFDSIQRHDISRNIKAADINVIATFHAGLAVPSWITKASLRGFILPSEYLPALNRLLLSINLY